MIEQELLLLGLLKEGPKHGYQIKARIKKTLETFTGLQTQSVYYPLKIMARRGLVSRTVPRSGRRPKRYVYRLTQKGEGRFSQLLNDSFLSIRRPYFNIDLSLYFLPYVKPEIARRRLRARIMFLKRIDRGLEGVKKSLRTIVFLPSFNHTPT